MKIKNLEFHKKPSPGIKAVGNQTLICSAYGNIGKMSGKWVSIDGTNVSYVSYRNGDILTIKAIVNKTGTYVCTMKSETEEIQTVTRVNFFSCKFIFKSFIITTYQKFKIVNVFEN